VTQKLIKNNVLEKAIIKEKALRQKEKLMLELGANNYADKYT
jgi:hypothetical protein